VACGLVPVLQIRPGWGSSALQSQNASILLALDRNVADVSAFRSFLRLAHRRVPDRSHSASSAWRVAYAISRRSASRRYGVTARALGISPARFGGARRVPQASLRCFEFLFAAQALLVQRGVKPVLRPVGRRSPAPGLLAAFRVARARSSLPSGGQALRRTPEGPWGAGMKVRARGGLLAMSQGAAPRVARETTNGSSAGRGDV